MPKKAMSFSKAIKDIDRDYCKQEIFIVVFNFFHSAVNTEVKINLDYVGRALMNIAILLKEEKFQHDASDIPERISSNIRKLQYIIDYIQRRVFFIEKREEDKHISRLCDEFRTSMKTNTSEELDKAFDTNPPVEMEDYNARLSKVVSDLILEGRNFDSVLKALLEASILCSYLAFEDDLISFQATCHVNRDHIQNLIDIDNKALNKIDEILAEDKALKDLLGTDDHRASTSKH